MTDVKLEAVAYGMGDTQLGRKHRLMMVRLDAGQDGCTTPLCTLESAQQAVAEREQYHNAYVEGVLETYAEFGQRITALETELDKAQDEINCAEESLEAASCDFVDTDARFNQGFECLGDFVQAVSTAYREQIAAARLQVAELEETVRHLNHALRDATEAPTFMGEPATNELIAPLVRSQYQHKRAQDRITALEAALRQAVDALLLAVDTTYSETCLIQFKDAITAGKEALK